MKKDIKFQYKLSNRITNNSHNNKNSKMQGYFICFSLLSDIMNKGCKFNLVQPISTVVNYFPKSSQNGSQID